MNGAAPKTVLVLGATGRFGGITDLLLGRGHRVRAAVRDPSSHAAASLAARGARTLYADFEDSDSLRSAAEGADAVFASGTAHKAGPGGEARHGVNVADAMAAAGVPHLVFISGAGADRHTGVAILEAKRAVERRIAELRLPVTLLAPVYLMENLFNPWILPAIRAGRLPTPLPPRLRLQQVAIADIIALAALAIERPEEFTGQRIEVASDDPTGDEAAASLSSVLGVPLAAWQLDRTALPPGVAALLRWLEREPFGIDIGGLRQRFGEVRWHTFAAWAQEHKRQLAGSAAVPR